MPQHEIRGAWFIAAREEVAASFGEDALEVLIAAMPTQHQTTLRKASAHTWYPEAALQACLRSLRHQLAGGHAVRFGELLEACTRRGVGRFFSALLGLSSPRFVLTNVPRMWSSIRRGPGFVTVDHESATSTMLRYRSFPYFRDPIYEELTVHSVSALVRLCDTANPIVSVENSTDDSLDLRIDYGA